MYERVWKVKCSRNGFIYCMMIWNTEEKLRRWMEKELPEAFSYCEATEAEELAAKVLGLPICYC